VSSPDVSKQVYKTFEIINSWIKYLKHKRLVLPSNFDYDFFFDGVLRCLASEQALIAQIGLSFVTVNFSFFNAHHRLAFFRRLVVSGTFVRLFIHWSGRVRNGFFKFLLYSIHLLSFKKSICTVQAEREVGLADPERDDHGRVLRRHDRGRQAARAALRPARRPGQAESAEENRPQAQAARDAQRAQSERRRNEPPQRQQLEENLWLLRGDGAGERAPGRIQHGREGAAGFAAGGPCRLRRLR